MSDALLEELSRLQQENAQIEKELDASVVGEQNQIEKDEVQSSNAEAMARGAVKGFSFGLDDEMMAGIQALGDTVQETDRMFEQGLVKGLDKSLSTYAENFRKRKQEYEEAQRKIEEKHPISFNLGDIIGSAGSFAIGGAPKTALHLGSKLATTGFMHGFGRSDAETLGGRLESGMEGAEISGATGFLGEVVPGAVGRKVVSKVEDLSADRFLTFLRGGSASKKLSKYNIQENLKEKKVFDWASEVLTYKRKDGKKVLSPLQDAESALDSTRVAMKETGADISDILSKSDKVVEINVPALHSKLKRKLVDPIMSREQVSPKQRQNAKKLEKYLEDLFYMDDLKQAPVVTKSGAKVYPKVEQISTVQSLQQVKTELFDEIVEETANKSYTYANSLKKLAHELHSSIDEVVRTSMPDQYKSFRQAADKYRNLSHVNDALEVRVNSSDSMNFATRLFLKATAYSSVGAMAGAAVLGVNPGITAGVATGIALLAKHPQTNAMAAKGLAKLANGLKARPDVYSNIAARINQAATVSSEAFHDEVMSAAAYVDLSEEPLGRTMDDLLLRQDSVLTTLNSLSPKAADDLDKAIKNKNERQIGEIIGTTIGSTSQMAPGIGFNGKAFTDKDKNQVRSWIKQNVPNSRQRMKLEKKFNSDFTIPEAMLDPEKAKEVKQAFVSQEYQKARDKVRKPRY